MKDFAFIFRQPGANDRSLSEKEIEAIEHRWHDWIGGIAAQGKLSGNGARLTPEGKVLKEGGLITDGPFVEIREILGGLIIVKAENIEEATTLAHGCPAIDLGGSVEIRAVG